MAAVATDIGTGTTIAFAAASIDNFELLSVAYTGSTRGASDSSHMGSSDWRSKVAHDLRDPGQIECEFNFDQTAFEASAKGDWVKSEVNTATLTITFPSGDTFAATAVLDNFEFDIPLEDKMTARATFILLGAITWADVA